MGERDARILGFVGADGEGGVGGAVLDIEMPAAGVDEVRDEGVDAIGDVDAWEKA